MARIFISYTHKDNAKLTDEQQGWVDRFHEALKLRVDTLFGREIDFWRDLKVEGNDILTASIEDALQDSSLLVSVVSPGYLNSEWCAKELRLFCESALKAGGVEVGTKSRIYNVIKTPIREAHLRNLPGMVAPIGYPFHRIDDRGIAWEYDPRMGKEARHEFLAKVNELAHDLCQMLESSEQSNGRRTVESSGIAVYLAETTSDMVTASEMLRRELHQFGHLVLPESRLRHTHEYAERVRSDLQRVRISIHPIGRYCGVIPEDLDRSVVEIQYGLAGEAAELRTDFTRIAWMLPGTKAADARQQAFIDAVQNDAHLMVTSLETLKTRIQGILAQSSPRPVTPTPMSAGAEVYLICDAVDEVAAKPIEDYLFSLGFEVNRPLLEGDESAMREDHEENLKSCDAVLIFYGKASEFWLRRKLRDLQKAFGYGRTRPFLTKAVFLADPKTPEKAHFRSNEVVSLPGFGAFNPPMLEKFANVLLGSHGEVV
jgi:hypothetical protein